MTAGMSAALADRNASRLYQRLKDACALILESPKPPYRAVANGDARRRPMAWVDEATLTSWREQGLLGRHRKGWTVLARPGPRPLFVDTPEGRVTAEVRENWMQRLARDLDLPGPLAQAGHRLVADGLRVQARSYRSGSPAEHVDGAARSDGEEMRVLARLDARRRVNNALGVLTPRERAVVEGVCINDRSIDELAHSLAASSREMEQALTLALVRLATFYGTMPGG